MIARVLFVLFVSALNCWGGTLFLKKTFVEQVKNAATVETDFSVDDTLDHPHTISSGGNDGDIHAAGRDTTVRLPMVVEITNAGMDAQKPAMDAMIDAEGKPKIPLVGVWRVWFEHPSANKPQIQGSPVPKRKGTNPDHMFELHPLSAVNGNDCTSSFTPIPGYDAYDAERAFAEYEKLICTIRVTNTAIQIDSKKVGFNHTQFRMELVGKPKKGSDGALLVLADVYDITDQEEKVNSDPVRMVFVNGSTAAQAVASLHDGDHMNVLGIPRVDLNKVSAIAKNLAANKSYKGPLPYEIIVVAQLLE